MKRFFSKALFTTIVVLAIVGCATMPQISKSSSNYLEKGMVSARFKGNEFYVAVGDVDLYHYNFWGNLVPTGQTVEIAVAAQADKDTGEILRIATMQAKDSGGVTVADSANYVLGTLRGGISVIDVQPYPRWLDAIQAMRKAVTDLDTYTQFAVSDESATIVVAVAPAWGWWGWRWGWGWRDGYWHRRWR